MPGGHTRGNINSRGRILKFVDYLGGEDYAEEGTEIRQNYRGFSKDILGGHRASARSARRNSILSSEIRDMSRRRHLQSY
jgi:hypothetical protein